MNYKRQQFSQSIYERPGSDGLPTLVCVSRDTVQPNAEFRVTNTGDAAFICSLLVSAEDQLILGDPATRGSWDSVPDSGVTVQPGVEAVLTYSLPCRRLALSLDQNAGLNQARVTGLIHADFDVVKGTNGVLMTTGFGGTVVPDSDNEGFVHDVTGFIPETSTAEVHYTGDTLTAAECYGGLHYLTTSDTFVLPAVAVGMSVTFIAVSTNVPVVDPAGSEVIRLNGVALTGGFAIKSGGTAGEIVSLTYYGAGEWYAATDAWVTNGA